MADVEEEAGIEEPHEAPPGRIADFVRENPLGAVIGAFVVGVIIGRRGIL